MKKKILWLGVSWLIVAALVLASCGPAVPGEEEEEEEEAPTLSIGETYQTPKIAVTVSEAIVTDSFEYIDETTGKMSTKEASPGTYFLIITAEIKNVGDIEAREQGQQLMVAYDSEGTLYSPATFYGVRTYPGEDALPVSKYISPGEKIQGRMALRIPEVASGLKIAYLTTLAVWGGEPLAMWEIE